MFVQDVEPMRYSVLGLYVCDVVLSDIDVRTKCMIKMSRLLTMIVSQSPA
jgi:hypothetical protein